ncbi:hypothetical protein E2C01_006247 [Portunus trituberculatus]|uniref:Uncharacterized protein n=1 Tax=Portunus trituberculatus TaxID=210409 RepID=A0A5B7CVS7_PORTR|nr:hypothetical protein [Portunus trituberculatus]
MSLLGLVDRLLLKRPVTFLGRDDQYLLRDGTRGKGGFEKIGKDYEAPPLCLRDYLSYDEMKLSALLSVSSASFFVNDGSRKNQGVPGARGSFQDSGVIVGMVGARLKKAGYMEWQDCVVTPKQNTRQAGYGASRDGQHLQQLWARLWGVTLPVWEGEGPAVGDDFLLVNKTTRLNVAAYKARMQLTAETLLAEAKSRAVAAGLKAYVHVVGLGLGVWRASPRQDALFVEAWGDAIKATDVTHVAHIDFSWIGAAECHGVWDGQVFPGTQVVVHFTKRSLHDPVPAGTLLVVSYAWDGNSMPGNEYWIGKLASTGDGAAACSSGVAELHNAYINPNVRAANLHVAGPWGVMHVAEYASRNATLPETPHGAARGCSAAPVHRVALTSSTVARKLSRDSWLPACPGARHVWVWGLGGLWVSAWQSSQGHRHLHFIYVDIVCGCGCRTKRNSQVVTWWQCEVKCEIVAY